MGTNLRKGGGTTDCARARYVPYHPGGRDDQVALIVSQIGNAPTAGYRKGQRDGLWEWSRPVVTERGVWERY